MHYDVQQCESAIYSYQFHMMRDAQQSKARGDAFRYIKQNENAAYMICDWAQKVLPAYHRESMTSYFGKRGMSVHIHIFFFVRNGILCKEVYTTIAQEAEQTLCDVLAISQKVFEDFHHHHPEINTLLGKSDRAGCYTGNG